MGVTSKRKKNDTADNLLLKDRKKKNEKMTANAQNNTFASPDTQADASACKRVVFLPTHPSTPTTLNNFLTSISENLNYTTNKMYFSCLIFNDKNIVII